MDIILNVADYLVFDKIYASILPYNNSTGPRLSTPLHTLPGNPLPIPELLPETALSYWARDYVVRQTISLSFVTVAGIMFLYFTFAGLSYKYLFNHDMMHHPKFLKNQVKLEIQSSMRAFPAITFLTLPWFVAEVMGYSKLYDEVSEYGWGYFFLSIAMYLLFTDYLIYWIHRIEHIPVIYKHVHKPHHKWVIPTPFASHAFHPIDGYAQSIPYHLFIFIFPLHRKLYLGLFVAVNFWSIFIHDSDMITGGALEKVINGPAHHTMHHLYFTCNYGQYFTWADRVGKSYRQPDSSLDPMLEVKLRQNKEAAAAISVADAGVSVSALGKNKSE
ncbi:C5-sterol desaturase [Pterulicium gracile]|uniref:C5-sterol desaturase n=1 Tax=Pterulicium gracile TaxID=1884261 RepID=A0A5C3QTH4_9AGAR|nr:C5-sterol desaturase [Pterula gracilis]